MPNLTNRESASPVNMGDEINLAVLLKPVWRQSWVVMISVALALAAATTYLATAAPWYRIEVVLAPAEQRSGSGLPMQLSSLAALAGVSVDVADAVEAVATLRSREFVREFIVDNSLIAVLFSEKWDLKTGAWRDSDPADQPDIQDAVEYFRDQILNVIQDRQTGLVTLVIEWTDPEVGAQWASDLVHRLNAGLRLQAIREGEARIDFLKHEMNETNLLSLQQSISRILELELQKLMLARGTEEFALRVIDPAYRPRDPVRPQAFVSLFVGLLLGAGVGVALAFLIDRRYASSSELDGRT